MLLEEEDTDESGFVQVPRSDWKADLAYTRKPSAFLRSVEGPRLDAMATLLREATEAVQRSAPQTGKDVQAYRSAYGSLSPSTPYGYSIRRQSQRLNPLLSAVVQTPTGDG
jgi:hypothetical protein